MVQTIAAMRAMWAARGEPISYQGSQVRLDAVALQPAPSRACGPPIWLAGAGEAAERRVGRIADGWLPYPPTPDLYAQGWRRVQDAADRAGRANAPVPGLYATVALDESAHAAERRLRRNIERYYQQPLELIASIQAMYAGTPEGLGEWLEPYVAVGARHVIVRVADEDAARGLESAAQARAAVVDDLSNVLR
jgi:alkanesulfonate monooxygenase SsuD/methylene tetrahydromethanopterin reductase-like flavin-dependent oxidoreductase (luciferase family)